LRFASIGAKQKPELDEISFQRLLAAAYVVQAHNDTLRANNPRLDTAHVFAEIAEIQSAVRAGRLDLAAAAKLTTGRLLTIVQASGVSLSLITNGYLDCVAESGIPASIPGSSVASHSLVATERLIVGKIFDSADAQTDIRLDASLCASLGVGSLVAAPVFRNGELAGLIEVRWSKAGGFRESEIEACRSFADLATAILEQPAAVERENANGSSDDQIATAAPQKESFKDAGAIVEDSPVTAPIVAEEEESDISDSLSAAQAGSATMVDRCRVCGRPFAADESFCGYCSMPRPPAAPAEGLQSKWASMWHIQKAQSTLEEPASPADPEPDAEARNPESDFTRPSSGAFARVIAPAEPVLSERAPAPPTTAARVDHLSYFQPLPVERNGEVRLQSLDDLPARSRISRSVLSKIRGRDLLLVMVAAVLAFGVISAWPSSSTQPTWFQSVMVRLGLAHAPGRATIYGNPEVNVWMDVRTALYYCPGSDLYGKTPEGRFAAQRAAQQERYEPATGLACQ
jgi:hypothetical protein